MVAGGIPPAELEVTVDLVRRLLAAQHPDLADRDLTTVANGWDNVIVRIGDDLVARLPRRQLGADLVAHEQRWLPDLARRLPIPIAAPVRAGAPSDEYPWRWSICRWFEGDVAADVELADPDCEAARLAAFVAALHIPAPPDAPANPFRGQPVSELLPRIADNLGRLDGSRPPDPEVDGASSDDTARTVRDGGELSDRIRRRVAELARADSWTGPPMWLHGDLHSSNIVVGDGAIAAIIDLGDLTAGDPAVDLAVGWMLFDRTARERFRAGAGVDGTPVDDATWARAQVWGLHFGVLYLLHSVDNERFERMGRTLLDRLLAER